MPAQVVNISNFRGLHLQANSFAAVPDGALEVADNLTLSQDGIARKRRGFFSYVEGFAGTPRKLTEYRDTVIMAYGDKLSKVAGGVITDYAGTMAWALLSPRFAEAAGSLFVSTDTGIRQLESLTSTPRAAGIPGGLDLSIALSGQSGPIAPDSKVGYRIVFGREDENGNRNLGAPSAFASVTNPLTDNVAASYVAPTVTVTLTAHGLTGTPTIVVKNAVNGSGAAVSGAEGTYTATIVNANTLSYTPSGTPTGLAKMSVGIFKQATLDVTVPSALSSDYFVQVYRTDQTATASIEADEDTLKLLLETGVTAGEVSSGSKTINDAVDDLFRSAYLYTNPNTGIGIINSNFEPPVAKDLTLFKSHMFYADVESKEYLSLALISAQVMVNGDTVTVGGKTYTAAGAENVGARQFKLTKGTGSIGFDIDQTARSLCRVINRDTATTVYARYESGPLDTPGSIRFQARQYNVSFTFATTKTTAWNPDPTGGLTSKADVLENVVYFSKFDEPAAVPLYQYLPIGSKGERILRIVALRDSLIVIKENSVWRINGQAGNFTAILLDSTIACRAPESVVAMNNQVMMMSNQGLVGISESGATVLSRMVETPLVALAAQESFYTKSRAIAYESERLYILSTISEVEDADSSVCFVFNLVTEAPSRWMLSFEHGIVTGADDKLMLLAEGLLLKERKNQNKLDYTDLSFSTTVISVATDKLTAEINDTVGVISVGDVLVFGEVLSRVIHVDLAGIAPVYTFDAAVNFGAGDTVGHYKGITSTLRTAPITLGSVAYLKHFSEAQVHTRQASVTELSISFISDAFAGSNLVRWRGANRQTGFGFDPWGFFAWGNPRGLKLEFGTASAQPIRTLVPVEVQKSTWLQVELTHREAAEALDLQAITLKVRPINTKNSR